MIKNNFYKYLSLLLIVFCINISSVIVNAEEKQYIGIDSDSYIATLYNEDGILQPRMINTTHNNIVLNSDLTRASATLSINRLTQYDSRWAKDELNGCPGLTIKSHGCALVSMTMVYNYLKGNSTKPNEINNNYVVCGMNWSNISSSLGFRISSGGLVQINNSNAYANIKPYLDNGNPVIVKVVQGNRQHWMVAYGYNSNGGVVYVRDPDETNFTTLSSASNSGWYVDVMIAFSN